MAKLTKKPLSTEQLNGITGGAVTVTKTSKHTADISLSKDINKTTTQGITIEGQITKDIHVRTGSNAKISITKN